MKFILNEIENLKNCRKIKLGLWYSSIQNVGSIYYVLIQEFKKKLIENHQMHFQIKSCSLLYIISVGEIGIAQKINIVH
jgi:hypothetical protein